MEIDELMRLREAALEAEHGSSTSRNKITPPAEWRLGKPGDPATCEPFTVMWNGTGQAVVSTIRRPVGEYFLAMHQQLPDLAAEVRRLREDLRAVTYTEPVEGYSLVRGPNGTAGAAEDLLREFGRRGEEIERLRAKLDLASQAALYTEEHPGLAALVKAARGAEQELRGNGSWVSANKLTAALKPFEGE